MKILVISPHRDDAAFSLSLSIGMWARCAFSAEIVNCFTQSRYAPYASIRDGRDDEIVSAVSRLREKEDLRWLSCFPTGVAVRSLGLLDAPLRLFCHEHEVCDVPVIKDQAFNTIAQTVADFTCDAIILPLALGHHVDHVTARDAARQSIGSRACAFYEDLPYAARPGAAEEIATLIENLEEDLQPAFVSLAEDCAQAEDVKEEMIRCYASQVDEAAIKSISRFGLRYGGRERLWVNGRWDENIGHLYSAESAEETP